MSKNSKSKLPATTGNGKSFLPDSTNQLVSVPAELRAQIEDADKQGFEEPRETLPIVTIRQKEKKDDQGRLVKPAGGFKCWDAVFPDLEDAAGDEGLRITIILDQRSRIYWRPDQTDRPACKSRDGRTGQGDPGGECSVCPLAQWPTQIKEGEDSRPKCAEEINLLCYDHDLKHFYVLTLKRSGLKPYNIFKVLMKRSQAPLHFARLRIKTEYRKDQYEYYVPVFQVEEMLDVPMLQMMKQHRTELSSNFGKTVEMSATSDEETGGGEGKWSADQAAAKDDQPADDDQALPF